MRSLRDREMQDVQTVASVLLGFVFAVLSIACANVASLMMARGAGRIVNVSSVAATLSSPGEAAYDASKSALSVFSEAMAIDLWETGVRVLVVYPGVVDTELFAIPDNDPLSPAIPKIAVSELADGVMDAIARDALEVYVPAWFKQIAAQKASDVEKFLAGSANWVRQQRSDG